MLFVVAPVRRRSTQAIRPDADHKSISTLKETTAMNLSPEQIQEHIDSLANASVEETDELLHDLFCLAWPSTDSQNN
jgi:hypothetical protein